MMHEIRQINAEDLHLIQEIVYETWPNTYGEILTVAQLTFMLEKYYNLAALEKSMEDGQLFYIFFEGKKALGFIGVQPKAEPNSLKLNKLYVLPESQGKSIGAKLFSKVEEITLEYKLKRLFLNVNRFNKAKLFYESKGMSVLKEEDIDIGNGYLMEDFVMEKVIR